MTPQKQLKKWCKRGRDHGIYIDDDGKLKCKYTGEVVACKLCGLPTDKSGSQLCDNCREITKRLEWIDDLEFAYKVGFILTKKINELMEKQ